MNFFTIVSITSTAIINIAWIGLTVQTFQLKSPFDFHWFSL